MRLFIGYESARYFWLRGSSGLWPAEPSRVTSLAQCAYNVRDVKSFLLPRDAFGPDPLHILVDDPGKRRDTPAQKCHVWANRLAEHSLVPIGHDVFVASPALCFLQSAPKLPFFDLVELGFELCGGYSRTPGVGNGLIERYNQLATPRQIVQLAKKLSYAPESEKALRAARRVLPNSKSPAETDLAVKLMLPLAQGGYGLPAPELNASVTLTDEAFSIMRQPKVFPDVMWRKAKLCLEYDSSLHHAGETDRIRDSKRRNALGCMGFKVITVTPSQLTDVGEFDGIASEAARHLGVRLRATSGKTPQRRYELNQAIIRRMENDLKPSEWPYI